MTIRMGNVGPVRGKYGQIRSGSSDNIRRKNLRAMARIGLNVTADFLKAIRGNGRIAAFFKTVDIDDPSILRDPATTVETINRLFRRWYVLQTHSNPDPFGSLRPGEGWFCLSVMAKGPAKKLVKTIDLGAWYYRRIWK